MFWNSLLRLASLIVFSVACTALFAISLICVIICFKMAIVRMIIMISVCRGVSGLSCSLFGFLGSTVSLLCPILGLASCWLVLLFFLPSFFLFALLRKVYRHILCHGYFLNVSVVYFGYVTMIVFDLYLVLSQKS